MKRIKKMILFLCCLVCFSGLDSQASVNHKSTPLRFLAGIAGLTVAGHGIGFLLYQTGIVSKDTAFGTNEEIYNDATFSDALNRVCEAGLGLLILYYGAYKN